MLSSRFTGTYICNITFLFNLYFELRVNEKKNFIYLVSLSRLFCRSGYDLVLLQSYLVPYLVERKQRPKIDKRGNKVSLIRTRCGVSFRDVCKLLAPNTNLRSFGQLFQLEQQKAYFPFAFLDSVDKLNATTLPTDPKAWASDLTGAGVTTEDIASAFDLFQTSNCKSVGDYLEVYLILDVVILFTATLEWVRHLKDLTGVNFIESRKYTMSSLSNLASGKSLVSRQEVGNFFVNNSQHYRLLRGGMRG